MWVGGFSVVKTLLLWYIVETQSFQWVEKDRTGGEELADKKKKRREGVEGGLFCD